MNSLKFSLILMFSGILVFGTFYFYDKDARENKIAVRQDVQQEIEEENKATFTSIEKLESHEEVKAIWVSFMSLGLNKISRDEKAFKEKFDNIVKESKEKKFNTLIVHVRSHSDAMYPSKIFPWSHLLTGEQGKDPGYDPLEYMVKACHSNNLKIHAWVNPFRVHLNKVPANISSNNPFLKFKKGENAEIKSSAIELKDEKFYNPHSSHVRKLIICGIEEIVENYKVDGIHLDDYFYPTEQNETFDKPFYEKYCKNLKEDNKALTIEEFRRASINSLVSGIYSAIKAKNKNIEFGVSPRCNIDYDLKTGADVISWAQNPGYVDYICPQIYMNFEHPTFPFEQTAKKWRELVKEKSVKLYLGLGVYKAGSNMDNGTWKNKKDILAKEVECGRSIKCDGFILYSFDSLFEERTQEEVVNVIKTF